MSTDTKGGDYSHQICPKMQVVMKENPEIGETKNLHVTYIL